MKNLTTMQEILEDFLKHIMDVHCDEYGNIQVCREGDELDPTVDRVVASYIKENLPEFMSDEKH